MDDNDALTGGLTENAVFYAVTCVAANGADSATKLKLATTHDNAIGFTDVTVNTTSGDATVTHDNVNTVVAGMSVSGNGIPEGAYVASINSVTSFELNANATVSDTDITARFSTIQAFTNNTGIAKMNLARVLTGTSDTPYALDSTQPTAIYNREYPTFKVDDADGGEDAVVADSTTGNAAPLQYAAAANRNRLTDLTGIELSLNKVDEDISYFGQRTPLKATVKDAIEISFTRKKSDPTFSILAKTARCGLKTYTDANKTAYDIDGAATSELSVIGATEIERGETLGNTTTSLTPFQQNWGYRIHLQLKSGEEVVTIRNACISDYSVTLNADGISEESITFYSAVEPIFDNDDGYHVLTPAVDLWVDII